MLPMFVPFRTTSPLAIPQMRHLANPDERYHDDKFWVICEYILNGATLESLGDGSLGVLFQTVDPFQDDSWSDPLIFHPNKIDPDIFWDDDGTVYISTQGIVTQKLDLETGELSQPEIPLWNGTGGVWPEGPHIYKKDGWYYLLIAEGGTGGNHAVTIARAEKILGPYEANEANPILTNRYTDNYFQRVGHGDLFDDTDGNWWAIVHASRGGPELEIHPMARESVLAPARWDEGEWPVISNVTGEMDVWPLPKETRDVPGVGPFNGDPDELIFDSSSTIPKHFLFHRVPNFDHFRFTDDGLEITPSRSNLTGKPESSDVALTGRRGISFIGRRQTATIFDFGVDLSFTPMDVEQEAGITVFLAQENHVEISLTYLTPCGEESGVFLRFRGFGAESPRQSWFRLPQDWLEAKAIRLHIEARDAESYVFGASIGDGGEIVELGTATAALVTHLDSAMSGTFIGALVGAYATCNGAGQDLECPEGQAATFQNWRYRPVAQYISPDREIPVEEF